jgi:hypothetical protein
LDWNFLAGGATALYTNTLYSIYFGNVPFAATFLAYIAAAIAEKYPNLRICRRLISSKPFKRLCPTLSRIKPL